MAKKVVASRRSAPTPPQFAARLRQLHKRLKKLHLDALLITNPRDIRYLCGFVGDDSWALVQSDTIRLHIISDSRFEEQIQREAPHVVAHMRRKSLVDELQRLMDEEGLGRVGMQSQYVSLALCKQIEKKIDAQCLRNVDDGLLTQRAVKDKQEVALIRKAGRIQQQAFERLLTGLRPGQTENELAARLEYEMRLLGADGPSFNTIVAVGANASLPHAIPGRTKVRRNDIILIDWGARYQGYCSDMTRVLAVGRMPPKIAEIYKIVLEAQQAGIAAIQPGIPKKQVDAAARRVIDKAGYGEQFGHGLGHGLGLNIHEEPAFSRQARGELQPGHVVTVEPGIYLPGVGGVRIEDDVLVTARGRSVLTADLPKSIEWAII